MEFKKQNLIWGWAAFAIAAVTYILTIEPTASLWDCPEFIATSYKLEVGHPPGAPLFMMISRLFTLLAPSPMYAAAMVNTMSALASAFTVLFLFWTITHLGRRMLEQGGKVLDKAQVIMVVGAGFIGATAYTFTDTFWFSAVEGEVYALSSMFTALVVWAMLKWEEVADEPHSTRWLVLIAYLMGLSIGIHILNLLTIPALVFIYYFKKYPKVTTWGVIGATAASVAILGVINFIIIPYAVAVGAWFDRIFVNGFGAPVNSGITFYVFALFALLGWAVWYTYKKGKVLANTIVLCVTVIMLGYGSYASVLIRASVNPPMNSNKPDNPYALLSLLNRDQYGQRPLLFGPSYNSPVVDYEYRDFHYLGDDGKYKTGETVGDLKYAPGFSFFFSRMYDGIKDPEGDYYKSWTPNFTGRRIPFNDQVYVVPTFGDNVKFFFNYQFNFMFWRYFMWNFVGRQNDIQAEGQLDRGNWLSGVKFIDEWRLGPQTDLPSEMTANKARNVYFFLPFLLGIIGVVYQFGRDKKNFTVVMWLMFMIGFAMVLYFNTPPSEPRERDYAYAGAFYAFCIWVGLGVMSVAEGFSALAKKRSVAIAAGSTVLCLCVPAILAAENWDDHDRSHSFVARDIGYNYLSCCLPNSIIMNFADNDTFPLWFNQEVEGVRTDVRIMNMSYLDAEWYIDEMRVRVNESDTVPFSLPRSKYVNTNESIRVDNRFDTPVDGKAVINFIASEDPRSKAMTYGNQLVDFIPANRIAIPVNKQNVLESGIVKAEDMHLVEDTLILELNANYYRRGQLMLLDLLANFDWKRPLYFTSMSVARIFGLENWLQFDGYGYRLVPIKTPYKSALGVGRMDTEYTWKMLMETFRYGNVKDPRVYTSYFIQHNYNATLIRNAFTRLANQLIDQGDTLRARDVMARAMEELPFSQIFHSYQSPYFIDAYYRTGETEKADTVMSQYVDILSEWVLYYNRFKPGMQPAVEDEMQEKLALLSSLYGIAQEYERTEISERIATAFSVGYRETPRIPGNVR